MACEGILSCERSSAFFANKWSGARIFNYYQLAVLERLLAMRLRFLRLRSCLCVASQSLIVWDVSHHRIPSDVLLLRRLYGNIGIP
jgi:hypothetical protein